jgi:hypothetical protein
MAREGGALRRDAVCLLEGRCNVPHRGLQGCEHTMLGALCPGARAAERHRAAPFLPVARA